MTKCSLRAKWLPVLKSGKATREQLTEYKQDVLGYKQSNPSWHRYIN
ncbi:MAG: hypothetical protein KDH96_02130 [Candidatus Riesia sp.]|nr:hypothetical protein [Candidatus Riesia sp.]